MLPEAVVVHASALVDLLLTTRQGNRVHGRLRGTRTHAPAQVDADVMACLARLDALPAAVADDAVRRLGRMPLVRHATADLLTTAWTRRQPLGPADMLYVAAAERLNAPLITTDPRLATVYDQSELIA